MAQFICASQGAVTFTVALLFKSIESVARVRKSSPMLILLKLVMRIRCVDHLKLLCLNVNSLSAVARTSLHF